MVFWVGVMPFMYFAVTPNYVRDTHAHTHTHWGMPTVRESIWHGTIPLRIILADNEARNFEKPEYMVSQVYNNDAGG